MSALARPPVGRIVAGLTLGLALSFGNLAPATAAVETLPSAARALVGAGSITPLAKAKGKPMATVINAAKKKSRAGFNQRLKTLKESAALVAIDRANSRGPDLYIEFFAAVVTQKKADSLVKKTTGKRFVVSGTKSRPRILLVSNLTSTSMPADTVPAEPDHLLAGLGRLLGMVGRG